MQIQIIINFALNLFKLISAGMYVKSSIIKHTDVRHKHKKNLIKFAFRLTNAFKMREEP